MPDKNGLPTEEELLELPRWARVVFALRCAQRVRPWFAKFWRDAPEEHIKALDTAYTLVQASAARPASTSQFEVRAAGIAADDAADAADTAARAATLAAAADAPTRASDAARAAAQAARAAADAAADAHAADAAAAAAAHAADADADTVPMIRQDYERLRDLAKQHRWMDKSPVDAALLGPLWPDGLPEGWPEGVWDVSVSTYKTDAILGAPLSLYFDADEYTSYDIAKMIDILSELYQEVGGDRLIIDSTGVLESSRNPEVVS